ncbi:MAG: YdiU family protein [Pseudomonadota bacterium]
MLVVGLAAELTFDNRFTRALPADPETANERRQVSAALYSRVTPQTVSAPRRIAVSEDLATELGFSPELLASDEFLAVMAGNATFAGMDPHATVYGGHQFGNWAGQLGDGRAINLGEIVTPSGAHQMLQLKGAGPTPYSRMADGLAVLRSSVREFLCSEAMHHLGVPTTRALALVLTGESVLRDMLYDGNAALEPGAVVCRVASSFVRFGHFELPAARGDKALLRTLADFVIRTEFPELLSSAQRDGEALGPEDYLRWYATVVSRTARLLVDWQRFGFVHGVMNTDNLSITGLTIDYGPYGWLDDFDPDWTPNTTDAATRRYRYGQQPAVAHWNLAQLANALYPLIETLEPLQEAVNGFSQQFNVGYAEAMAQKLGFAEPSEAVVALASRLEALLPQIETDMTICFRRLNTLPLVTTPAAALAHLEPAFYATTELTGAVKADWEAWLADYQQAAAGLDQEVRHERMRSANPVYVLRNYLAQQAIDRAEAGDFSELLTLQALLRTPFEERSGCERYAEQRPDWARTRVGCSQLSCSS